MNLQTIQSIVTKHKKEKSELIGILTDIQTTYSYLPEEALRTVAEMTETPLVDVYGVATFYKSFSLEPRGRHLCSVCVGTACHVRGSERISEELQKQLEVKDGGTTKDREFTLEKVACLGACALGPIVTVDGHYFSNVKINGVKKILDDSRNGLKPAEVSKDERNFPVDVSCPKCNHSLMDKSALLDGRPSVRVTTSFDRKHGWVRISSIYGSYTFASEPEIPLDTIVDFFCPHCHAEMISASSCSECGAPMVPMIVRQGGVVQICAKRGCPGHILDLSGDF